MSSSSSLSSCPMALFNNSCITDSPCKVDFNFIADCALPALPEPIYDCTPPICPAFEPIPPEFCPEITSVPATVTVTYLSNCSSSSSSNAGPAGAFVITKSVDCSYILGLDLDIPIKAPPCPIFTTTQPPKVNVVFDQTACGSSSSGNTITITPIPGDCADDSACSFDINLDLNVPIPKIPCPTFTENNKVTVTTKFSDCATGSESTLTATTTPIPGDCKTPDTCQFDLTLDLVVPIPKIPCPTIDPQQPVKVTPYYKRPSCQQPVSTFTVTTTPIPGDCNTPDTCQFGFDLDLFVPVFDPPCPKFNTGTVAVTTHYQNEPPPKQSKIDIAPVPSAPSCNDPQQCEFNVNLDLVIPIPVIPCPQFRFLSANAIYRQGPQFQINAIQVLPLADPPNNGDPCQFDIFLDITIPPFGANITILPTEITKTTCDADPEFNLVLSDKDQNGMQTLQLKAVWPVWPWLLGGAIDLGPHGSGRINVNRADPCNTEVTATINLNTTACATGGGGGGGGGTSSTTTTPCNPATDCGGSPGSCPPGCDCSPGDPCTDIPI